MREVFYWPTLFKYAHAYARKFPIFQNYVGRQSQSVSPLQSIIVEEPFQQW